MNIKRSAILPFFYLCTASSAVAAADLRLSMLDMDLAALGDLHVYTASRYITDVSQTPAVTTVITAEDIQRRGYRSLYEVMQHMPGVFYTTTSHFENLTSRGMAQALSSYLLLIDGHAINDKSSYGISVDTVFPTLTNVERIEVVRGAGSVLWGSEAGVGIIHIITKSGSSLDISGEGTWNVLLDYEAEHQRDIESATYARDLAEGDYIVTLKRFNSDAPHADVYWAAPGGIALNTNRKRANFDIDPSYDFYFKGNWNDFGLKSSLNEMVNHNYHAQSENETSYQRNWIELSYTPRINDQLRLENKIFYNDYKVDYFLKNHAKWPGTHDITKMKGYGIESLIFRETDDYNLVSGIKIDSHDMSLVAPYYNTIPGVSYDQVPPTTDQTYAVFSELNYALRQNLHLILGARYQKNDGILDSEFITPRLAAIYNLDDHNTLKYIFNGSEVAPNQRTWQGGNKGAPLRADHDYLGGADDSQKYQIHDLQYQYSNEQTFLSAGLFYMQVDDLIHYYGSDVSIDGDDVFKAWANGPGATSKGLELELKHRYDSISFYGNYTYAKAKYNQSDWTLDGNTIDFLDGGFRHIIGSDLNIIVTPEHMWNLGTNIDLSHNKHLNIHYRGYSDLGYDEFIATGAVKQLHSEHFVDMTLVWQDSLTADMDLSFYIKNVTNNKVITPDEVYGGYSESALDRQFGMTMEYSF